MNTWVNAGYLTYDDVLQNILGEKLFISNLVSYKAQARVYNLIVNGEHTFYVGVDGILSHNSNCFKLKSRIKENKYLVRQAEKAGKNQQAQKDIDDLTSKLSQGNLNPGKGTKPIGKGISERKKGTEELNWVS